jgi:hypothetical protein
MLPHAEWKHIDWGPVNRIKCSLDTGRIGLGLRFEPKALRVLKIREDDKSDSCVAR